MDRSSVRVPLELDVEKPFIMFSLCLNSHLGDNCIQNFYLGRYIARYTVGNLVLR